MERIVKNEVMLPKTVPCTVFGKDLPVINCEYWATNVNDCKAICLAKVMENPSLADCAACSKRKSYNGRKMVRQDESSNLIEIINITMADSSNFDQPKEEPKFTEKAKNYISAEMSQAVEGKVSEDIFEKRKKLCMSCEFRVKESKNAKDSIGWCKGGCGCTVGNPRAALSQKLYMPSLQCPKGKFGKENGQGFNVTDAKDSAKGLISSVMNLFKKD